MKNNIVTILLVVAIGVVSGLGVLLSISNAVQVSAAPLAERMERITDTQREMAHKLEMISTQLGALDAKISTIQARAANPMAFGAPQPQIVQPPQPPSEDMNKVYDIPVGKTPIVGKNNARITITEFSDLQCPYCARFYPMIKAALEAFPNDVKFLMKNYPLPFHPNAMPAAKMALAANEQGKYIQMVEALLDNGGDVSEAKVKDYAQKLGLNYDKLMADLKANDAKYSAQIKEDMDLAEKSDVRGTPTFFINGKKTSVRDPETLKSTIKGLLGQK